MPRRTNLFQDVVAIIHRHMAGDARVEESALLSHQLTGADREVDVVISSRVAGHDVVVSVEATKTGQPADVTWVEQQVSKHAHLPTSKLVLVSAAGFSDDAHELALASHAVPIQPQDLTADDPSFQVVNKLRSIWPKELTLTVVAFRAVVTDLEGMERPMKAEEDEQVFLGDGTVVATMRDLLDTCIEGNIDEVGEQLGLAQISEDQVGEVVLVVADFGTITAGGETQSLHLRSSIEEGTEVLLPIAQIQVAARARVRVSEVSLEHGRLGEVLFSHGEGRFGSGEALFVVTENESGGNLTIRPRNKP